MPNFQYWQITSGKQQWTGKKLGLPSAAGQTVFRKNLPDYRRKIISDIQHKPTSCRIIKKSVSALFQTYK
jgi:hypothetical protein